MESIHVKEYMNTYPVTFTPEMSIAEASCLFLKTKQIGGPVVNENGKLMGFLSESEVLKEMLNSNYSNEFRSRVADIMRTDVLSVKPYDSVIELAQTMLQPKPKVYPVVGDDGKLLGTICRNDVLKAIDQHMQAGSGYKK
jgi:predicted transcriptional regulator